MGGGLSRGGGFGGAAHGEPSSLRDALFGDRDADRHFGSAPPIARYNADAGGPFVLDRATKTALLRFDDSPEIWALTASPGPRGDLIFKNDVGEPMLRVSRLGGVTLFTNVHPMGMAAYMVGQAGALRLQAPIGPNALYTALVEASRRASHAAQHLIQFDAPDTSPSSEEIFADAFSIASDAIVRLAGAGARGRGVIQRLVEISFIPGRAPGVVAGASRVEIVVAADRGGGGAPLVGAHRHRPGALRLGARSGAQPLKASLPARSAPNACAGARSGRSAGARRKGLAARSAPTVVGTLGSPRSHAASSACAAARAAGSVSTERAKRALPAPYSCAAHTCVCGGRAASRCSPAQPSSAEPSNSRPQPSGNRASPTNTTAASGAW